MITINISSKVLHLLGADKVGAWHGMFSACYIFPINLGANVFSVASVCIVVRRIVVVVSKVAWWRLLSVESKINLNWNWSWWSTGAVTLHLSDGFSTSSLEIFVLLRGDIIVAANQAKTETDLEDNECRVT